MAYRGQDDIKLCPACYMPCFIVKIELTDDGYKIRTYACEDTECGWIGTAPFTGW